MKSVLALVFLNTVALLVFNVTSGVYANWQTINGTEYFISIHASRYIHAQETCENMNSHLVAIENEAENTLISSATIRGYQYWIGLKCNQSTECNIYNWHWLNGKPVTYSRLAWHIIEHNRTYIMPNNALLFDTLNAIWMEYGPDHIAFYVCEKPPEICASTPCENGGMCVADSITYQQSYSCQCLHGFTGLQCQYSKTSKHFFFL